MNWPPENPEERFIEAWKEWTQRMPRRSSAQAAMDIAAEIGRRKALRQRRWSMLAAAAMLVAITGLAVHRILEQPAPAPIVGAVQEVKPLGEGQVLMWLDADTPLYMTFQNP